MSAIWGIINLDRTEVSHQDMGKMTKAYDKCIVDKVDVSYSHNAAMGCAHQFFTKEAKDDILPYENEETLFSADVVLDNRNELQQNLKKQQVSFLAGTDGELLRLMFENKGLKGIDETLGAFTFANYDKRKNKLSLGADAVSSRILYYCREKNTVYFSTLLQAILNVTERSLNQRWFADFLAMDNLGVYSDTESTTYEGIYAIPQATIIEFTKENTKKEKYWDYESIKINSKMGDREVKEKTISIFQTAVKSTLRSSGKTAILLSGGLDSTSVACFAARELKPRGENLYSYTSIPEEGYDVIKDGYCTPNETSQVKETVKYLGNVIDYYVDLKGVDWWKNGLDILNMMESPYKAGQNIMWMLQCQKEAHKDGCKIMLTGQYGNVSLSYGNYLVYCNTLLSKGHVMKTISEVNALNHRFHNSRKQFYMKLLSLQLPHRRRKKEGLYSSCVSRKLVKNEKVNERLRSFTDRISKRNNLFPYIRGMFVQDILLRQIGDSGTKMSLETGVLLRDPTRDKRLIEFMLTLPMNQFDRNGMSRRLVYCYLKEYLPEAVLNHSLCHRGAQSADLTYKLSKDWPHIYTMVKELYHSEAAREFINIEECLKLLEKVNESLENASTYELFKTIYIAFCIAYLEKQSTMKEV